MKNKLFLGLLVFVSLFMLTGCGKTSVINEDKS